MVHPLPRVYVDFNNADCAGRVRLNCQGTLDDVARQGLVLHDQLEVVAHDDGELEVRGVVERSQEEGIWVFVACGGAPPQRIPGTATGNTRTA